MHTIVLTRLRSRRRRCVSGFPSSSTLGSSASAAASATPGCAAFCASGSASRAPSARISPCTPAPTGAAGAKSRWRCRRTATPGCAASGTTARVRLGSSSRWSGRCARSRSGTWTLRHPAYQSLAGCRWFKARQRRQHRCTRRYWRGSSRAKARRVGAGGRPQQDRRTRPRRSRSPLEVFNKIHVHGTSTRTRTYVASLCAHTKKRYE